MQIAIGKKLGMTQIEDDGRFVGATAVELLPLIITQIKSDDIDGYSAVQVGVINKSKKKKDKPIKIKEFRILGRDDSLEGMEKGKKLSYEEFSLGDRVSVSGVSYGRGFQGVIKRHGFHRGPKTHGSDHHRAPGSIGMCSFPARVFKGKKMPGRDGIKNVKIKNLRILELLKDKSIILLHGSVPGKKNSYLGIKLTKKGR